MDLEHLVRFMRIIWDYRCEQQILFISDRSKEN